MQQRLELAFMSKARANAQMQMKSKQSEIIYQLATQTQTIAGIRREEDNSQQERVENFRSILPEGNELRVDGFLYQGNNGVEFSIQNENGLLPINSSGQYWLGLWLENNKFSKIARAKLLNSLTDYADADNDRMPFGSEGNIELTSGGDEYSPRNYLLQSCNELALVKHWANLLSEQYLIHELCSLRRGTHININAIPIRLWKGLWPNSAESVENLRAKGEWFANMKDVLVVEPKFYNIRDEYYSVTGGRIFTITTQTLHYRSKITVNLGVGNVRPFEVSSSF
jgi:general secretion pathway protein K